MKKTIYSSPLIVALATMFVLSVASYGQSPIVNMVHAGGPDVTDPDIPGSEPGFDKNYSLVAFKYADGSAAGIFTDRFAGGGDLGLQARIDCVHVEGNNAWVSGVVTSGATFDVDGNRIDITGFFVRTRVQDNGNNNDPANPDRIGVSVVRSSAPWICSERRGGLFDFPTGQVRVR